MAGSGSARALHRHHADTVEGQGRATVRPSSANPRNGAAPLRRSRPGGESKLRAAARGARACGGHHRGTRARVVGHRAGRSEDEDLHVGAAEASASGAFPGAARRQSRGIRSTGDPARGDRLVVAAAEAGRAAHPGPVQRVSRRLHADGRRISARPAGVSGRAVARRGPAGAHRPQSVVGHRALRRASPLPADGVDPRVRG